MSNEMTKGKSLVFLLGRWAIGGVEQVTVTLSNEFIRRGWRVCIVAFEYVDRTLLGKVDPRVRIEVLGFPAFRVGNILKLRNVFKAQEATIVVNQWALPFPVTLMIRLALSPGMASVAFHHTIPSQNNRMACAKSRLVKRFWREMAFVNLRLVYGFNDAYCVLSERFFPIFKSVVRLSHTSKLHAIPNPVELPETVGENSQKDNVILFVGRLSRSEKRVDRILSLWAMVSHKLKNWRLDIVGDGPDRVDLEKMAENMPRIQFYGFQSPFLFYSRSKILLLTSAFEGFGLVIVEAMARGCVPLVLNSFPTASDIIHDGNGVLVEQPWNCERFSDALVKIALDETYREKMMLKSITSVNAFSVRRIAERYESLFREIVR